MLLDPDHKPAHRPAHTNVNMAVNVLTEKSENPKEEFLNVNSVVRREELPTIDDIQENEETLVEEDPGLDAHIESPGFDHQLEEDESAVSQEDPDEENKIQEEDIYEGDSDEENGVEAVYNGLLSPFKKPSTRASAIKRHQKIPNENMAKFYKEEEKMVKELSKTDPEKFGDLLPRHRSLEKNLRILVSMWSVSGICDLSVLLIY